MMASTLLPPDADAQSHSAHLREVIQEQVIAAGGHLPFWKFMELALYAPGLGYYSAGAHKFGPGGDFTTAPELSPLFSACVAGWQSVQRLMNPEPIGYLGWVAAAGIIGVRALLVHALHEQARAFYAHFDFEPSPTDPLHLLLLIKDARTVVDPPQK